MRFSSVVHDWTVVCRLEILWLLECVRSGIPLPVHRVQDAIVFCKQNLRTNIGPLRQTLPNRPNADTQVPIRWPHENGTAQKVLE